MKRLGIFAFYEFDGYVDQYVEYLLDDMIGNLNSLIIVCNGTTKQNSFHIIQKYTNAIYICEELHCSSVYLEVLTNHLGFEELQNWDELVLFQNSFYGPIHSMKQIFYNMDTIVGDFWGFLAQGGGSNVGNTDYLQLDFLVVRTQLLQSTHFKEYWISDVFHKWEYSFTNYFVSKGYKNVAYSDVISYEKNLSVKHCDWSIYKPITLMKDFRYPIIKKNALMLRTSMLEQGSELLEYLEYETEYPVEYIWKHMIRTIHIADVQTGLGLEYIRGDECVHTTLLAEVAIFIHLYYEDMVEELFHYINHIPREIDVYLSTSNNITLKQIEKCSKAVNNIKEVILLPNIGRDVGAFLVGMKSYIERYEIISFLHDKKSSKMYEIVYGENFKKCLWDNLLKSEGYIKNIIQVLQKNQYLGLLVPPYPLYPEGEHIMFNAYGNNYNNMLDLAERLEIPTRHINVNKKLLALGTAFWCKTKALRPLFDIGITLEDFEQEPMGRDGTISHAIERIIPFVAQQMGYAVGVVEHVTVVEKRILIERELFRKEIAMNRRFKYAKWYIISYMRSKKQCYIYGNGKIARGLAAEICIQGINYIGHIVTKKEKEEKDLSGRDVYSLEEIKIYETDGVILALGRQYTLEVIEELQRRGFTDYCLYNR